MTQTTDRDRVGTTPRANGGWPAAWASGGGSGSLVAPRSRRRPAVLVLAATLALAGGTVSGWAALTAGGRTAVLAVARPVAYGVQLSDADLTTARITADSALAPVPASRRADVVGQYATVALRPGMLLTADAVAAQVIPEPGSELVPIAVPASRLPATGIAARDRVLIVSTPPQDGDAPAGVPDSVPATVVSVGEPDAEGARMVDVQVPVGRGTSLAARAATGRVALVVEPPS